MSIQHLIQPYDPAWASAYQGLKAVYEQALKDFDGEIRHVGSTAVPGLCAKPVLDIDIIITDPALKEDISRVLEGLGYLDRGDQGIPGRFAFRPSSAQVPLTDPRQVWMEHHLYLCYSGTTALRNHLLFLDILRRDPVTAAAYANLKMQLVQEKGMTRDGYNRRKTEFILTVLSGAGLDRQELNDIRLQNSGE